MITLIRLMIATYLSAKWKCAFWMEFNKQANELMKHPENIEKKFVPYMVEIIHKVSEFEKFKEATGTYMEK